MPSLWLQLGPLSARGQPSLTCWVTGPGPRAGPTQLRRGQTQMATCTLLVQTASSGTEREAQLNVSHSNTKLDKHPNLQTAPPHPKHVSSQEPVSPCPSRRIWVRLLRGGFAVTCPSCEQGPMAARSRLCSGWLGLCRGTNLPQRRQREITGSRSTYLGVLQGMSQD